MSAELDQFVDVIITVESATLDRAGFSTPLLAAYHTEYVDRVRAYSSISEVEADFAVGTTVYRAMAKIFGQEISPSTVKVGRRALAMSQAGELIPTDTAEGVVVTVTVVGPTGTEYVVSHTNGAAETVATICTALTNEINVVLAIPDLTATDNTTDVGVAADNAGELFDYKSFGGGLTWNDLTADPGIATDLAAIEAADDDWYGLNVDSNSKAEILAAAAWVETRIKVFGCNTADQEVLDGTALNVMEQLNSNAYARTYCIWSGSVLSFAGAAWMAGNILDDPGARTWKFKTLVGVVADQLTTTQRNTIIGYKGNWYASIAGAGRAQEGWMADGEWIDIQLTVDALRARIQEDVAERFFSQPKIPFTDNGANTLAATVLGALQAFQGTGALDPLTTPTVTVPKVADVSTADKTARLFPDVDFTARLAGAIHKTEIRGKLQI